MSLKSGDKLRIFTKDASLAWEGLIDLEQHEVFTEDAYGMWIYADQKGIPRDVWARYFLDELPAEL